jgi:hypothetical protein
VTDNPSAKMSALTHLQLLKIVSRLPARNESDRIPVVRENGCVEPFDALISERGVL